MEGLDFLVKRDELRRCRIAPAALPGEAELPDGEVLLRVDRFAFTANNVTYAAFGDAMSYWNFFPVAAGDEGWGRIPVWGFGDVVWSKHPAIAPGERFYGYFPMSTHLVAAPERASAAGFFDGAAHRRELHAVYNGYLRTTTDPAYEAAAEDAQMLLRPLFITSFLIDDFLADNAFFGARSVVLSSASSKTAYGLAFLLARRGREQCEVTGLTSAANAPFVERLGCYHRVLTYERIADLPPDEATVYVDMAGNAAVRSAVHRHFADQLTHSCAVGGTHWEARAPHAPGERLPGPRPTLFFAPAQIKKRVADWGGAGLQQRLAEAWRAFMVPVTDPARGWLRVVRAAGPAAVTRVYLEVLDGRARPEDGHVLTLSGDGVPAKSEEEK